MGYPGYYLYCSGDTGEAGSVCKESDAAEYSDRPVVAVLAAGADKVSVNQTPACVNAPRMG